MLLIAALMYDHTAGRQQPRPWPPTSCFLTKATNHMVEYWEYCQVVSRSSLFYMAGFGNVSGHFIKLDYNKYGQLSVRQIGAAFRATQF